MTAAPVESNRYRPPEGAVRGPTTALAKLADAGDGRAAPKQ
jgi:hypothetical protein